MNKKKAKDVLSIYLDRIFAIPELAAEEETELAKKKDSGDETARHQLVESALRFVPGIAKKYVGKSLNLTFFGLIGEGNVGLLRAVEKFEWWRGNRLSTYAYDWIESKIRKAVIRDNQKILSLDAIAVVHKGGDTEDFYAEVSDKNATHASAKVDKDILYAEIQEALAGLHPKERQVVELVYGLKDDIFHSIKDVAQTMDIKKGHAVRIWKGALRRLKKNKKIKGLR